MEKQNIIYIRVSTDTQELKQQANACLNYADANGIKINGIYEEIGSGKDFFNREKIKMIETLVKDGQIEKLIVFRLDRLGRNLRETFAFIEMLNEHKCQLISINEHFDTTTVIGKVMLGIVLVLAQLEREMTSEATKQRLKALKDAGKPVGRPKGAKDKQLRKKSGYFLRWERVKRGG